MVFTPVIFILIRLVDNLFRDDSYPSDRSQKRDAHQRYTLYRSNHENGKANLTQGSTYLDNV